MGLRPTKTSEDAGERSRKIGDLDGPPENGGTRLGLRPRDSVLFQDRLLTRAALV